MSKTNKKKINSLDDLNQGTKGMKYTLYGLLFLFILLIGLLFYQHISTDNHKKNEATTKYINYLETESSNTEKMINIYDLYNRNHYKVYKTIAIGTKDTVTENENNKDYTISNISGDQYTKAVYYKLNSENYIRITYTIKDNNVTSVKKITNKNINVWLEFDKLQNTYAKTIKDNGKNNNYKTNIINMINKYPFLYN